MICTVLYFATLLLITIYCFIKSKSILGKYLLIIYTLIAFMSVILLKDGLMNESGITLVPYFFLVLSYLVFFSPFLKRDSMCGAHKICFDVDIKYVGFAVIYIICSVISIKCYLPSLTRLISSGDWAINRTNLYSGELVAPYSNFIEYFSMQFTGYFKLLAIIVGFSLLRKNAGDFNITYSKKRQIIGILSIVASVASLICSSMFNSARGTIFNSFVILIAIYLFFYYEIEMNKRKFFTVLGVLVIITILPYIFEVTVSRFGTGDASSSIISYFGQAPIVFNKYVFTLNEFAWGDYGFSRLLGTTFSPTSIGGQWGASFFTFVGWLCIDWSPVGVLLIGVMVSYIFYNIIIKESYQIADVFLLFSYYQLLTNGVFVIGASYIYTIMGSLIIYIFLKLFVENRQYRFGRFTF